MAGKKDNAMQRYSISLTDKNLEQIDMLVQELGCASISEAVRTAIQMTHSSVFPKYAQGKRMMSQTSARATREVEEPTDEERAEQANARKRAITAQRKADETALCVQICEHDLNGVVADDENGNPVKCAYFQYDGRRRYEQEIDINSVTADLVNSQYVPNKDYVEKLQRDGHVDYDVNQTIEEVMEAED